jgi:Polyketide cyclase / dehydrase and lipid transport
VAHVVVAVDVAAPVGPTWDAITDWPGHGRFAPLTTVRVTTPSATGAGTRFVARTALGPMGFDDPMEVVEWSPPAGGSAGHCVVHKHGRLVLGTARIDVTPRPDGASRLSWTYDVEVAPVRLTRPFAPLVAFATRLGLGRVLRTVARDVERGQAAR